MAKSDKANEKTNVMRLLDQAGIAYTPHYYDVSLASGTEVAAALGQSAECVFKTLVAEANTGEHFVFVIPAPETLSLKKAAKAAGVTNGIAGLEKSVAVLGTGLDQLAAGADALREALKGCHEEIIAAMNELRRTVDALEPQVSDGCWPLPKYREMLFIY